MFKRSFFFSLALICPVFSSGQYLDFLKAEHQWPAELRVPLDVNSDFRDDDAVILYERLDLTQNFRKLQFQELVVEKHKLIFIKDPKIAENGAQIMLPEAEDELADIAHLPMEQRGPNATPELLDVELHYYAARIHKSNGGVVDIRPVFTFMERKVKRGDRIVKEFNYLFKHPEVEPGDILEIHYEYEVPYQKNDRWFNSFRILRNDRYARQIFDVSFKHESGLYHTVDGVDPSSLDTSSTCITRRWKFRNIPSIDDVGWDIRSMDEPIVLGLNTYADWMYNRRSTAGFRDNIPWYMSAMQRDYADVTWLYRIATKRISIDKQSRLVKKYLERTVADIPDSMPSLKGLQIHEDIRANFEWRSDDDWYRGANNELTRMGSQVEGKYLLDRSRRSVYTRLFFQCNAPVLYVRPLDKRIGSMREGYLGRLWKSPTMFALPQSGRVHYALPKSEYQNLYADEIPFYWENTAALLVNPFQLFARVEMPVRYVVLPGSTENDNRRKIDAVVEVDSESNSAKITMRVKLSGQFSTITRAVFDGAQIDSNVSRVYQELPLVNVPGVELASIEKVSSSTTFPFQHTYDLEFTITQVLQEDGRVMHVSLEKIFPRVTVPLNVKGTSFRPDFRFTDEVNVLIKWKGDVPISTNFNGVERTFDRSGWTYSVSKQEDAGVLVRSKMIFGSSSYSNNELPQMKELVELYFETINSRIPLRFGNP